MHSTRFRRFSHGPRAHPPPRRVCRQSWREFENNNRDPAHVLHTCSDDKTVSALPEYQFGQYGRKSTAVCTPLVNCVGWFNGVIRGGVVRLYLLCSSGDRSNSTFSTFIMGKTLNAQDEGVSHRPTLVESDFRQFYWEIQPTQKSHSKTEMHYLDIPQNCIVK